MLRPIFPQFIVAQHQRMPKASQDGILNPLKDAVERIEAGEGTKINIASVMTMTYLLEAAQRCKVITGADFLCLEGRLLCDMLRGREPITANAGEIEILHALYEACDTLIRNISIKVSRLVESRFNGLVNTNNLTKIPHPKDKS